MSNDNKKVVGRPKTLSDEKKADKRIVAYVNKTEAEMIKEIAKVEARTSSFIIRQAIQEFIENRNK